MALTKQQILNRLDSFIDETNPKLASFLTRQWTSQQNAITYKELREAIFAGHLDQKYLAKWQQDYSRFVVNHYAPLAQQAIDSAAKTLNDAYGGTLRDPQSGLISSFIDNRGGKLIREVSEDQYKAINTLVRQASLTDTMTVDDLARSIRPCVGLTQRQAQATKNYYDNLIQQGYTPKQARKMQAVYAERMHRERALTIATTEMSFAYNSSMDELVRQRIRDGIYAPGVKKKWITGRDERVCDVCGKMDNVEVDLDMPFPGGVMIPPAHPRCRCSVNYTNITLLQEQPEQPPQVEEAPEEKPDLLGQTAKGYTKEQQEQMTGLIEGADAPVRELWTQNVDKLKPVSQRVKDGSAGYFSPSDGKVHFAIQNDVAGRLDQSPYTLRFHEYGHNIDWLNAKGTNKYLSSKYRDPKTKLHLGETIMQECEENVEKYYNEHLPKYVLNTLRLQDGRGGVGHLQSAEQMLINWRQVKGIERGSEEFIGLREALRRADSESGIRGVRDFLVANPEVFRVGGGYTCRVILDSPGSTLMKDFNESVRKAYSWRERSDISDMFDRFSMLHGGDAFPFGTGHGKDYYLPVAGDAFYERKGNERIAHEAFAEMFSASISQPESLRTIKKFFPRSYQMFLDIIRSVLQ